MNKLPLEIVIARMSNFKKQLAPDVVTSFRNRFEPTEDMVAAAEYVAKTSGYNSLAEMLVTMHTLLR